MAPRSVTLSHSLSDLEKERGKKKKRLLIAIAGNMAHRCAECKEIFTSKNSLQYHRSQKQHLIVIQNTIEKPLRVQIVNGKQIQIKNWRAI